MHRIDTVNNAAVLPAPLEGDSDPGFFKNNPGASPGTVVSGDWLNAVQEELAAVVEAGGLDPDKEDNGQLLKALQLFRGVQIFSASGTFNVPDGVVSVFALVWGGGGSGGINGPAQGGGGGGFSFKRCTVVPGAAIAVTVGAPGSSAGVNAGGTSSFGAFCSATGGAGSGAGGNGSGGDINIIGSYGGRDGGGAEMGIGGGSPFGGAGGGIDTTGAFPGGGGGTAPDASSGGGAGGCVLVIW